jgi:hypothetical protein
VAVAGERQVGRGFGLDLREQIGGLIRVAGVV